MMRNRLKTMAMAFLAVLVFSVLVLLETAFFLAACLVCGNWVAWTVIVATATAFLGVVYWELFA